LIGYIVLSCYGDSWEAGLDLALKKKWAKVTFLLRDLLLSYIDGKNPASVIYKMAAFCKRNQKSQIMRQLLTLENHLLSPRPVSLICEQF
jgi:hypothetical protein